MTTPPPKLEILAWERTPLGTLCLRRRELAGEPGTLVTEVTLDHEFLMSSYHTDSERALASAALGLHPGAGLDVLVGGLGLGYTAQEALASPRVARVEVVEFLPEVIGWVERDLVPLAGALKADKRAEIARGDIYARLAAPPARRHDVILIDVDHSPEDRLAGASAPFYTAEGLRRVREHLKPGGVLGVWSYDENPAFAQALREVFGQALVKPVSYRNRFVGERRTDWLFYAGPR